MGKTKIICTIGPASGTEDILNKLVDAGMSIARCNFSHGTYAEHKQKFDLFKKIRKERGIDLPIMLDTKGPDVRTKRFKDGFVVLKPGQKFSFFTAEKIGDENGVAVTHTELTKYVKKGDVILLGDGFMQCNVLEVKKDEIITEVVNGGKLIDNRSVAVTGIDVGLPFMRPADIEDIKYGAEQKVDMIGASFVNCADDVRAVRKLVGSGIKIIAKIETAKGVKNLDEILKEADGVMVARGGLGTNENLYELPVYQKTIIEKAKKAGKFSIVATEMMDSMINNPRPTRAEVLDVFNAVSDGASAVMLSGETAMGKYPVETVTFMRKVADEAEKRLNAKK
jgi:pyruvate kinase